LRYCPRMRFFILVMALSAAAFAGVIGGSTELNPVRRQPHPQQQADVHQVIVKLRAANAAAPGSVRGLSAQDRIANLAARAGLTMKEAHPITETLHVMRVEPASAGDPVAMTVARLSADPDVEYAAADERRYPHAVPNDTLYPGGGQWYEQADPTTPAAVNAQSAWDTTTGDPNLVIADLDTGIRFDHPDLLAIAASGRLLPGYDFVSNATVANDGDGWDADPSDPGDWVTAADAATAQFKGCTVQISSWHGTRTAGILGALTNNAHGIAGMTWQGKILPVRVLGKCGGFDSDIISGMLWAAGVAVSGAPANPNPARIINMSFGSVGTCTQAYADAISQVTAQGALMVVSAGNEGGPVDTPANCTGVAAVAGLRQAGTKVGFSSLGPQIAVSAPAGNCINTTGTCVYSIQTTTNSGSMGPVANDDSYTGNQITTADQPKGPNLGTSFSAPIAAGIAALMAAVNSNLNSCQLISRLEEGSLPFPQTSPGETPQPTACHVPSGTSDVQDLECICTNDGQTCGAGMANAPGAIEAALRPIAAVTLPTTVGAGQSILLSAQNSAAANGHTISTYQWTSTGQQSVAIQNGTTATATVTAPSCGYATVQVAVTDEGGRTDTADILLSPTAATSTAPTSATAKSCTPATTPAVLLAVCPASSSVPVGTGSQAFTASVVNTANPAVTWEVNNIAGGNATVGTISTSGVYTAPATVPSPSTVTVEAVSAADQTVMSSTNVSITSPPSSHGGGAMDPVTLIVEALALGSAFASRRYASRWAASSQVFCARR
jgi:serine protease